jgi:flagellar biosynthesis anti-sigma factor FlgM
MSITGHDTSRTARYPEETGRRHAASRPASAEGRDQRHAVAAADGVGLSSYACDLQRAREVAQAAPEVRAAQVEAARRAVHSGSLTLKGEALAEKLLQESLLR